MTAQMHRAKNCLTSAIVGLVLAVSAVTSAHHSIIPFDMSTFSELEGVITEIRWRNPHFEFKMQVVSDAGQEEEWLLPGGSINPPLRRGHDPDTLQVGDRVRVAGWPSLFDRKELFVTHVLLANGEETVMAAEPYPPRWTEGAGRRLRGAADTNPGRSIFRVWDFGELYHPREPFVFTAVAEAARAAWDPFTDIPALRCIPPGMPNAILNPYSVELIDDGDRIRIRIEEWEATRVIDMISGEIPDDAARSRLGYSVGHWEGETLVVETARIDYPYLDDAGTPMSREAEIIERFTLGEDGNRLNFELTVTDPQNLVEPAIWDAAWSWAPGAEILSFECDLD